MYTFTHRTSYLYQSVQASSCAAAFCRLQNDEPLPPGFSTKTEAMSEQQHDREAQLKDMRRDLYRVEGGERLQLWMEYTRLHDEDADSLVSLAS